MKVDSYVNNNLKYIASWNNLFRKKCLKNYQNKLVYLQHFSDAKQLFIMSTGLKIIEPFQLGHKSAPCLYINLKHFILLNL